MVPCPALPMSDSAPRPTITIQPGPHPECGAFLYYNTAEYANYTSTYVAPSPAHCYGLGC